MSDLPSELQRNLPANGEPVRPLPPALLPGRERLEGRYVVLEPLDADRHAGEVYAASHGSAEADAIWTFLPYGPFASPEAFHIWLRTCSATADPLFFAVQETASGMASGLASFLAIEPLQGTIEVGHLMFGLPLQNSRAATEALFLLFQHVFDARGYRRLEWKCDAMNAASRRAAVRLGFAFEGLFYQHRIVKGRNRDTTWFSILDWEWPALRMQYELWLEPANFDEQGRQKLSLGELTRSVRSGGSGVS